MRGQAIRVREPLSGLIPRRRGWGGSPDPVALAFQAAYKPGMTQGTPADIAKLSFEDALAELEGIVRALEQGKGKLDESVAAYERGAALKKHCEKKLAEAAARIEKIQISGGEAKAAPFDADR